VAVHRLPVLRLRKTPRIIRNAKIDQARRWRAFSFGQIFDRCDAQIMKSDFSSSF
jgi:hypothetical protein